MNYLHKGDLPNNLSFPSLVAIDTETMGLNFDRDRLCVVQVSFGDKNAHLVQIGGNLGYEAKNLKKLLKDSKIIKIFHYARFDVAILKEYLGVLCKSIYCTKIASKLARTYTDRHGLKELCKELLNVEISKQQQSSDWGKNELSQNQINYAANDVLYLHEIKEKLDDILERENRLKLANSIFKFIPTRVTLDLLGWNNSDIFSHS
ncbi:MAG: Ribonuclease D [Alphaproteobacteria bacterium MarineAlpha9_Bin4]|nr:ribonuclease D [Pelagibacterales bacterium]PPR27343.1 MAG: Ribonuclease D [Alphaproteobacteria bacterium MarineAlpha9_Bin4]|tara:strand:+ start:342 stop:956 length:615 start_codon:yes stop_codon:yes gene_type:complete